MQPIDNPGRWLGHVFGKVKRSEPVPLSRDVEDLAHDRGHRILRLERKGGRGDRTVLTAPVARKLDDYRDGRTMGPLFITKTGKRMGQPAAWKIVRRLGRRAELDGAGEIRPHFLRVAFITGAREAGVPLERTV